MNKYAVITGASSGIGLEFARLLAADNYDVLLAARDKKGLEQVAADLEKEHGIKAEVFAIDLGVEGAADKLWDKTDKRHVEVLINNAGFGDLVPLVDANWEKLNAMIDLNITTLTRLSQLAATDMKKQDSGKILNVASAAAFFPGPGMATYFATKSYVLSFSEALAQELDNTNVTVTALCPGATRTGFQKAADMEDAAMVQGKLPTAQEVAEYGYDAMNKGKVVAIHGFNNKVVAGFLPRILPRSFVRKTIDRVQNKRV